MAVESYRPDHLKLRLKKQFGNSLVFIRSSKRVTDPEMVTAKEVPQCVLLKHAAENLRPMLEVDIDED